MSFDKLLQQSLIWRIFYFATSLLLNIVLSRLLTATGTGFVYYLSNFFSLILLIASCSIETGFTYFASNDLIESNKLAGFGVIFIACISIALIYFFRFWYSYFEKDLQIDVFNYCKYATFFVAGVLLNNLFTALFQAKQNFFLPNFLMGCWNIIFTVILIVEQLSGYSVGAMTNSFFIFILLNGMITAIAYVFSNRSFRDFKWMDIAQLKMLFTYSLVALTANIVFFLVYRIDFWFVKYHCSAHDLGNYIQASKVGQLILVLPQIIASAVFPQTASGILHNDVILSLIRLSRILMQAFVLLFLLMLLFGQTLFVFVFGQSFDKMQLPLLLLVPGILCLSVLSLLSAFFGGKGMLQVNVKGAAVALVIVVIGNIAGLSWYNIQWAAIVSSIGYFANMLYSFLQFCRMNKIDKSELFKWNINDWHWLKKMLFHK
jgi:O-antigen/teichoic acid export membrane protein